MITTSARGAISILSSTRSNKNKHEMNGILTGVPNPPAKPEYEAVVASHVSTNIYLAKIEDEETALEEINKKTIGYENDKKIEGGNKNEGVILRAYKEGR